MQDTSSKQINASIAPICHRLIAKNVQNHFRREKMNWICTPTLSECDMRPVNSDIKTFHFES